MSQKIVQINFKLHVSAADYAQACAPLAQPVADTPGLRWKTWLMNEAEQEAGGIYLFEDDRSAQGYLAGPIVGGIKAHPGLSDVSVKTFDVMEELSLVTRAPIQETAAA
jgi:hypothetical protein